MIIHNMCVVLINENETKVHTRNNSKCKSKKRKLNSWKLEIVNAK